MIRKIKQVAVIGSGIMGGGIAALMAGAGVKTLLLDIVPFDLKDEEKDDPAARNRIVKAGLGTVMMSSPSLLMQKKDVDRITIGNLEDDFGNIADCDWIVEVVVENLKIKQDLFKRIDTVRKAGTIVSSNTSGLPLKAMSEGMSQDFKHHFLGTHFFNPVRYMHLLEIIAGEETLPEVLEFIADFGERILGKGIVWAKDTPNFVGNRIGVQGIVKAMQLMLEDGLTIPEMDALFGTVMGRPKTAMFKTSDIVGLDTLGHVAKNTFELVVDDEQRDSFVLPEFVEKMIEKKLLGTKTGGGFYKTELTPEWKKIRKVIDPQTLEYAEYDPADFECLANAEKAKTLPDKIKTILYGDDKGAETAWKAVANNLIYATNRIAEISDTIVEIDNAMKWGFNFEMGPFETWDALCVARTVARMQKEGYAVPEKVQARDVRAQHIEQRELVVQQRALVARQLQATQQPPARRAEQIADLHAEAMPQPEQLAVGGVLQRRAHPHQQQALAHQAAPPPVLARRHVAARKQVAAEPQPRQPDRVLAVALGQAHGQPARHRRVGQVHGQAARRRRVGDPLPVERRLHHHVGATREPAEERVHRARALVAHPGLFNHLALLAHHHGLAEIAMDV